MNLGLCMNSNNPWELHFSSGSDDKTRQSTGENPMENVLWKILIKFGSPGSLVAEIQFVEVV